MKLHFTFLSLFLIIPFFIFSQKNLTIEEASGMARSVYPQSLRNLQWIPGSNRFAYLGSNEILSRQATSTATDTLVKLAGINKALKNSGLDTLPRITPVNWVDDNHFTFTFKNNIFIYDLSGGAIRLINRYPDGAENIDIYGSGHKLAYTMGNNLFIADSGRLIQVTADTLDGIVNGQTVHRNEFGIEKGTFWSPDGKYLAYYRKDETMVTRYPLVDIDTRIATEKMIRYPMAGMDSEQVTLVVFDPVSGKKTTMLTGLPADQYLVSVTWGPDNRSIFMGLLNRGQDHLRLNRYDAATGVLQATLFEEKHEKYVEPEHPLYFLENNPDKFIWFSERDGFQHIYLYDTGGRIVNQLTSGPWMVTEYLGADPAAKQVFFLATKNSPLNQDVFTVDLKTLNIKQLSDQQGTHSPIFSPDGKYFLDVYQDTLMAREYFVANLKGKVEQLVQSSPDPLADYTRCETDIFTLRADDGTELYSRIILPPGFDPDEKYPAIVYVYGGPHAQLVTNSWLGGASLFLYYLAQQGYIVFTLDNRGSANRGLEFEQAIFRDAGNIESSDQMVGVNYLKNLPFVDSGRIGVHGWSYGGFMTISLMLRYPEEFRTGVCGGPVTDWKYYEVMYGERYMDTPEENPDGYKNSSLLERAGQLKGDLLVIHGTHDPVVVWQHSLALMKNFIEAGVMADYFVYPGHEHGVAGKDRVHLNRKIEKYFHDHLK